MYACMEGIDPFRALSADCSDGVGVLGQLSTQVTDTGCFPKGLRLAVTSDVPVILHYS